MTYSRLKAELAEKSTFLESAYLLLYGDLPSRSALQAFRQKVSDYCELPPEVLAAVNSMPDHAHPMAVLAAGLQALGGAYPEFSTNDREKDLEAFDQAAALIISTVRTIAAAHLGHDEVVRTLIDGGASLNHITNLDWAALIDAIVLGDGGPRHVTTFRALVDAGADVNIPDGRGVSPLTLARQRGYAGALPPRGGRLRGTRGLIQAPASALPSGRSRRSAAST